MSDAVWALGLMSGTSLDGIDVAMILSDGERALDIGPALTVPYEPALRERLRDLLGTRPGERQGAVAEVERLLTDAHAEAVHRLLALTRPRPALIGFHGQTLFHAPDQGITVQIGDGARLAALTNTAVINDFRSADVAAGGEGAPLAPAWHAALACDLPRPLAVLNLGGVGNVTWLSDDRSEPPLAFDTGPGNALLDDWMRTRQGLPHDDGGRLAAQGRVDQEALAALLQHAHFTRPPPKSLDRNAFSAQAVARLCDADGAATLAAFTVAAVAQALSWMPRPPALWLVCGGGRHNPVLMAGLAEALGCPVRPVESEGWNGDALEAQAFAFLAVRAHRRLPLSWPTTTGVPHPVCGGAPHAPPMA
ncbi:anhydro-N-acetylmuramic acid kinase [Pararhodospirillum photometricum]|nr:anhydro-N-acetylmuramic acid kinase [Pararhodospirillum photometricum]